MLTIMRIRNLLDSGSHRYWHRPVLRLLTGIEAKQQSKQRAPTDPRARI